jgi:hypothetical protein
VDYGHYGHHHHAPAVVGWYAPSYQIAPRYVYRPYPAYSAYSYQPYYYSYPSSSLYIGGRNFSFGLSGF